MKQQTHYGQVYNEYVPEKNASIQACIRCNKTNVEGYQIFHVFTVDWHGTAQQQIASHVEKSRLNQL